MRFIVLDDVRGRSSTSDRMSELAAGALPHELSYLNRLDVIGYCERLARVTKIDPNVIRFALAPDESLRRTDGASKNALMLDGTSERYLQVDDDTECRPSTMSAEPRLRFYLGKHPVDTWYFRTRQAARDAVKDIDRDFVGGHESILGRSIKDVVARFSADRVDFEGPLSQLFSSLSRPDPPIIRVTYSGLVGDAASDSPFYRLAFEGTARDRLLSSEAEYHVHKLTREVVRVAQDLTVTKPAMSMAFAMGCDATEILPPFFPLGRSYEGAFSALLARCYYSGFVAQLPEAIVHSPNERPPYDPASLWNDAGRLRLPDLAAMLIGRVPAAPLCGGREMLRHCGMVLRDWAHLPWPDFNELIVTTVVQHKVSYLNQLRQELRLCGGNPKWWADDVRRQIDVVEQFLTLTECPQLSDYSQFGGHSPEGRKGLQHIIAMYGEVLTAWPTLYDAAGELKLKEHTLANRVERHLRA